MSKAGLSISDLQSAAKKLNTVDEPAERKPAKADASERSAIEALGMLCYESNMHRFLALYHNCFCVFF